MPCPPNRALADHFIFAMNTDFKKVAKDFVAGGKPKIDGLESTDHAALPKSQGATVCAPPLCGGADGEATPQTDAEKGIEALRARFEGVDRVRCSPFYRALRNRHWALVAGACCHACADSCLLTCYWQMPTRSWQARLALHVGTLSSHDPWCIAQWHNSGARRAGAAVQQCVCHRRRKLVLFFFL